MRGLDDLVQHVLIGGVDVDHIHAGRRHHHIASRQVGHAQHPFEHLAALCPDHVLFLGLGQGLDQFGLGIRAGMQHLGQFLQEASLVFRPVGPGGKVGH